MTVGSNIDYHLRELQIAAHPESCGYAMPEFLESDEAILDIGCGIGQTLVAGVGASSKLLVGMDIDLESQKYGRSKFEYLSFINAGAEELPFADGSFDFVVSRVTLPYTNIPRALTEINRILKRNGRVWITLHSFEKTWTRWKHAVLSLHIKDILYCSYVIVNGLLLTAVGNVVPWPINGRFESFQSCAGMLKAMHKAGFSEIAIGTQGKHLVCSAHKQRESSGVVVANR